MIAFEQDAMDLSLEHTKEQYTWIWRLNVKYLCGQCFMWTTFGKSKFLLGDFRILNDSRWAGRYGSLIGTYQRTAYLNLAAECEVFARAVMYVDNFRKIKISLGDFRMRHDSPWAGGYGSFVGTYLSTAYLNLGAECELFARAVVYVNNFWEIKNSLGDFRILHDSPWEEEHGSVVGIYQSTAYLTLVAECEVFAWVLTLKVSCKCEMVFCHSVNLWPKNRVRKWKNPVVDEARFLNFKFGANVTFRGVVQDGFVHMTSSSTDADQSSFKLTPHNKYFALIYKHLEI